MATTYPGIGNADNWESYIVGAKTAERLSDGTYRPIEPFIGSYLISNKLLAVSCASSTAPSYYKNAGWLTQITYTGLTIGGVANSRIDKSWFLLLNRINLIIVNPNFPDYSVQIDIPYWYDQIEIVCWRYTGPVNDSLVNQLANMDMKLDQILNPEP